MIVIPIVSRYLLMILTITNNALVHAQLPIQIRIATTTTTKISELDSTFEQEARKQYCTLDESPYFNRTLLKDIPQLCNQLAQECSTPLKISTIHNRTIHGTWFNRNSDTLLVIGSGFPSPRQQLAPFIHLFKRYDIVLFDYHGQGLEHYPAWNWNPSYWPGRLTYTFFDVDMNATGLGTVEASDVHSVVYTMRARKHYKHVHGLGMCYSSFIFAQAAAQDSNLFDKLILDSSWPSLKRVITKIAQEPSLVCGRQPPTSPWPWLTHQPCFQNFACTLTELLTALDLDQVLPLDHYLAKLNLPILFFQSRNDCYCSPEEFEVLWDAVTGQKFAVFTDNVHGRNHVKQKEVYAHICNDFFDGAT